MSTEYSVISPDMTGEEVIWARTYKQAAGKIAKKIVLDKQRNSKMQDGGMIPMTITNKRNGKRKYFDIAIGQRQNERVKRIKSDGRVQDMYHDYETSVRSAEISEAMSKEHVVNEVEREGLKVGRESTPWTSDVKQPFFTPDQKSNAQGLLRMLQQLLDQKQDKKINEQERARIQAAKAHIDKKILQNSSLIHPSVVSKVTGDTTDSNASATERQEEATGNEGPNTSYKGESTGGSTAMPASTHAQHHSDSNSKRIDQASVFGEGQRQLGDTNPNAHSEKDSLEPTEADKIISNATLRVDKILKSNEGTVTEIHDKQQQVVDNTVDGIVGTNDQSNKQTELDIKNKATAEIKDKNLDNNEAIKFANANSKDNMSTAMDHQLENDINAEGPRHRNIVVNQRFQTPVDFYKQMMEDSNMTQTKWLKAQRTGNSNSVGVNDPRGTVNGTRSSENEDTVRAQAVLHDVSNIWGLFAGQATYDKFINDYLYKGNFYGRIQGNIEKNNILVLQKLKTLKAVLSKSHRDTFGRFELIANIERMNKEILSKITTNDYSKRQYKRIPQTMIKDGL